MTLSRRIAFLLLPGFSLLELSAAIDTLRVATRLGVPGITWSCVSLDGGSVQASNGLIIATEASLDAVGPLAVLFVVASYDQEASVTRRAQNLLRRCARHGVRLGAFDTGAFVLARAGLLGGRRVTVHWESLPAFCEEFPEIDVRDTLFEIDRDRLTCAGGVAVMDMMLHLIEERVGAATARLVADQLLLSARRSGDHAQRDIHQRRSLMRHPSVGRAAAMMEENLSPPLAMDVVAARAGVSLRQLERLWRDHPGGTPKGYYTGLRLERARQLLVDSRLTVTQAALAAGFDSPAHFSRQFRRHFGYPPGRAKRGQMATAPLVHSV
ncbi:AraC family transcriptional regulator [Ameyamaea chiangmaiensis NBRC 103196]|uniref:GlxA family transcriptional regulator n=1 Tax=Ameyamaea chiangmaiensis TaxID=442969 RepID=A0A850PFD8_9PROT|nr:GlxA family transcriptional regulator [Ameyamaea chiangmaiensis]MBS4076056.1 GlxA family transcriptional regulator [Ameyamaea chiangmaiensis]NVN39831.1 GlxA family transcriptional regulator [Ameyamaea chiangmaiensis]GBQ66855.1 AraC family transcriptional regulator [Ameyamaea chiangmaiensis NBRC 103196]